MRNFYKTKKPIVTSKNTWEIFSLVKRQNNNSNKNACATVAQYINILSVHIIFTSNLLTVVNTITLQSRCGMESSPRSSSNGSQTCLFPNTK